MEDIRFTRRTAFLIVCDILATFLAFYCASVLTGLVGEVFATHEIYFILGVPVVVNLLMFAVFKMYNNLWEYASVDDAIRITIVVGLSLSRPCCYGFWANGFPSGSISWPCSS